MSLILHRCMEHSIHLGASHFVNGVSPTSNSKIIRKVQSASRRRKENDGSDGNNGDDNNGDDNDDNDSFNTGDAVGKALGLIKQVYPFCLYSLGLIEGVRSHITLD